MAWLAPMRGLGGVPTLACLARLAPHIRYVRLSVNAKSKRVFKTCISTLLHR